MACGLVAVDRSIAHGGGWVGVIAPWVQFWLRSRRRPLVLLKGSGIRQLLRRRAPCLHAAKLDERMVKSPETILDILPNVGDQASDVAQIGRFRQYMSQFISGYYRFGFRQRWIFPCVDQIGKIWRANLEKITMGAASSSRGAHPGCSSVRPCVHAVGEQRGSLSACGECPCSSCGDRGRSASSTKGRALSACIGSPTLGSTCGRVFLSWRGRAVLETFCDLFAFLDDRRALGKAAFARSPVLPVSPRCPHRPRFLAGKNRKSGLARTNAFRYHISSRRGRGSAGRARPCQGRGRGFEPRRPLHRLREAGHT